MKTSASVFLIIAYYIHINRMEKFLLIVCVVLLPTAMQGLLTKHKGSDILVRKVIDRLIQQHSIEVPKKNIYTVANEEITNVGDNGGEDVLINGIQSFIKAKRLVHAGYGIVKRSFNIDDLHARGTSTTPKPPDATTSPSSPMPPAAAATTTPTTTPVTTTTTTTTTAATIILGPKIELPTFDFCRYFWIPCRRSNGRRHGRRGWPFKR